MFLQYVSLILLVSIKIQSSCCAEGKYTDWDFLIFTQRWPITTCSQWHEQSENNECALPEDRDQWTVHGIWPNKIGKKLGPFFCNTSWHFNMSEIAPILPDLDKYWINVEKNTKHNSLWRHEWLKHGTCAAQLPQLANESLYFRKGLEWNKRFELPSILSKHGIVPNSNGYSVEDINNAIKQVLKCTPVIECVVDKITKQSLISEIRLCFDKSLDLIDCDGTSPSVGDKIITNCDRVKDVMYPKKLFGHAVLSNYEMEGNAYYSHNQLVKFYKLLKMLIWVTI